TAALVCAGTSCGATAGSARIRFRASASRTRSTPTTGRTRSRRIASASAWNRRGRSLRKQSSRSFLSMPSSWRLASLLPNSHPAAAQSNQKGRRELCAQWPHGGGSGPARAGASKDQPRMGYLVERPDRTLDADVGYASIVARQRRIAIGIEHLFRNWPEGGHEMIGRLENQNPLSRRI